MAAVPVSVQILDKEYQVACEEEEKDSLIASAAYISDKMMEIRQRGNVIGTDRIAVVAALNVAHELLQMQTQMDSFQSVQSKINELTESVSKVLDS